MTTMQVAPRPRDTDAWVFQAWAAFVISFGTMLVGIMRLPVDPWIRGFLGMGLVFTVNACFGLAKTIRDNHESQRLVNRISDAKAEKLLREYELKSEVE